MTYEQAKCKAAEKLLDSILKGEVKIRKSKYGITIRPSYWDRGVRTSLEQLVNAQAMREMR